MREAVDAVGQWRTETSPNEYIGSSASSSFLSGLPSHPFAADRSHLALVSSHCNAVQCTRHFTGGGAGGGGGGGGNALEEGARGAVTAGKAAGSLHFL